MEREAAAKRIAELSEQLEHHNHLYYVEARPVIDGSSLMGSRHWSEVSDSLAQQPAVGGDITGSSIPCLTAGPCSRSATATIARRWPIRGTHRKLWNHVAELKYDGVAISLTYEHGELVRGLTRGDGEKGDDITANVRTVRSIPLRLRGDPPAELEARGEILMGRKEFEKLNEQREEDGEELFANPRNTTAGTLKLQDPKVVAKRGLQNYIYSLQTEPLPSRSHYGNIMYCRELGFRTPDPAKRFIEQADSLEGIMAYIAHWDHARHELDIAIDGVVIKVDNIDLQEEMGFPRERWAAYKFKRAVHPPRCGIHGAYRCRAGGTLIPWNWRGP